METMILHVEIELENDAMATVPDVRRALVSLADKLSMYSRVELIDVPIRDENGNTVGFAKADFR